MPQSSDMKIKLTYVTDRGHRDPASMLGQRYFLACSATTPRRMLLHAVL